MRLAAIDVGSNSVHMVIADVSADGHVQVVDRVKEVVRLGRRSFMTGRLAPQAMDLAAHALGTFARLARVVKRAGAVDADPAAVAALAAEAQALRDRVRALSQTFIAS